MNNQPSRMDRAFFDFLWPRGISEARIKNEE